MKLKAQVKKVGIIFNPEAQEIPDNVMAPLVADAVAELADHIRAATPRKSGKLASSIKPGGQKLKGIKGYVRTSVKYGIPLDKGYRHGSKRIPGKQFFFATFDRVGPAIQAQLLGAIGVQVVKALGGGY